AMGDRRRTERTARAGEDHERAPADRRRPCAAAVDRGRRPPGLRRHARGPDQRDRARRVHQDREQGKDEPALHHCAAIGSIMDYARPDALVSTEWLAKRLDAPDIRIVDGSFYLPAQKREPKNEFLHQHIPGAVFFDIDEIADTSSPLPHMLPSAEKFSARVRKLGLGDGNKIIVYDTTPMTGACRVWWMFRAMGHKDVAVLDGGLPKWMAEGHPVTDDPTPPRERHFTARLDNTLVRSIDDVRELIDSKREQIVDARAAGRFRGETPEPRAGLRSGH